MPARHLRRDRGLKAFNEALKAAGHDLAAWRAAAALPLVQTAVLDANDDSGWELATALLQARPPNWADAVMPTRSRPSADEALSFRFFATRARKRAPGSKYSTALAGQRALARLETQMMEQTKAVREHACSGCHVHMPQATRCMHAHLRACMRVPGCAGEQHEVQG